MSRRPTKTPVGGVWWSGLEGDPLLVEVFEVSISEGLAARRKTKCTN